METKTILEQRNTQNINDFIQSGKELFEYYELFNDKVTMEFIALKLSTMNDEKYNNLSGNLDDLNVLKQMREKAELLLKARFGKQAVTQMFLSLLFSILVFLFLNEVVKTNQIISFVTSLIVMVLVTMNLMKTTSNRLVKYSEKLYKEKVDEQVIDYFNFYLD